MIKKLAVGGKPSFRGLTLPSRITPSRLFFPKLSQHNFTISTQTLTNQN
jgi:hypothetical protein